jgi:hypothetical protein
MNDAIKIIKNGLWNNNQALVALLGLCPLLAVTNKRKPITHSYVTWSHTGSNGKQQISGSYYQQQAELMTLHFCGWNCICHVSSHCCSDVRSFCKAAASSSFRICLYKTVVCDLLNVMTHEYEQWITKCTKYMLALFRYLTKENILIPPGPDFDKNKGTFG